MKLTRRLFALLFAVCCAANAASLTGTVKDPQGRPVPSAAITLFSSIGGAGAATTTNAAGTYRLESLAPGSYLVRAEAPGFAPMVLDDVRIEGGTVTRDVSLAVAAVHEQVVVTASGTPQSSDQVSKAITVIDQNEGASRDAGTVADVVRLTPSVRVLQLGGPGAFTSIQIRGLRAEDTAVLVDGLRLRDASATQADASGLISDLLFTDSDRVEVLRGSGSSLYGTNAIGGVVNVITDEGGGRTRGSVLLEGGSLGTFRGRAQFAGGMHDDRIQYSLGLSSTDVVNGVGGDAPFRETAIQGRATFRLLPTLRLTARWYAGDSFGKLMSEPNILGSPSGLGIVNAIAGTTFIPAPDNPDYTRAARFLSGALVLDGQASPKLDYSVSYQALSNGKRYGDGPAGTGFQPAGSTRAVYDGRIQTVDAQVRYHPARWNLLSAGYEFENENYANDNADRSDPAATSAVSVTQRSQTVFAQDQAQFFHGALQFSAAVRAQFFQLSSPGFLPAADAPYHLASFPSPAAAYTGDASAAYFFRKSGTKLRAHVGRGYRAPSLFERFGAGFDPVFGYSVYGDPRLKPEHSIGLDAGVDQSLFRGRLQMSASYFYTWLQSVINFDTSGAIDSATDPFGRFIGYVNTRGGISRGVELSAAAAVTRTLQVTTAYTYANALERTPIVGDVIQSWVIPRHQFSILVTEQPTSRLSITVDTLASSSYLAPIYGDTVTQTYRFGGVRKVNSGASYRIPLKEYQAVRFFVRAENLFDQAYFDNGFRTPGRTAMGGMQFEF
jgi:iron complex outermembrane receptor protein